MALGSVETADRFFGSPDNQEMQGKAPGEEEADHRLEIEAEAQTPKSIWSRFSRKRASAGEFEAMDPVERHRREIYEKVGTSLDARVADDLAHVQERIEHRGAFQRGFSWLQKNSWARVVTSATVSLSAGLAGAPMVGGWFASRIGLGATSGMFGGVSMEAGLRQARLEKQFGSVYRETGEDGKPVFNIEKIKELPLEERARFYAQYCETGSALGQRIELDLDKKLEHDQDVREMTEARRTKLEERLSHFPLLGKMITGIAAESRRPVTEEEVQGMEGAAKFLTELPLVGKKLEAMSTQVFMATAKKQLVSALKIMGISAGVGVGVGLLAASAPTWLPGLAASAKIAGLVKGAALATTMGVSAGTSTAVAELSRGEVGREVYAGSDAIAALVKSFEGEDPEKLEALFGSGEGGVSGVVQAERNKLKVDRGLMALLGATAGTVLTSEAMVVSHDVQETVRQVAEGTQHILRGDAPMAEGGTGAISLMKVVRVNEHGVQEPRGPLSNTGYAPNEPNNIRFQNPSAPEVAQVPQAPTPEPPVTLHLRQHVPGVLNNPGPGAAHGLAREIILESRQYKPGTHEFTQAVSIEESKLKASGFFDNDGALVKSRAAELVYKVNPSVDLEDIKRRIPANFNAPDVHEGGAAEHHTSHHSVHSNEHVASHGKHQSAHSGHEVGRQHVEHQGQETLQETFNDTHHKGNVRQFDNRDQLVRILTRPNGERDDVNDEILSEVDKGRIKLEDVRLLETTRVVNGRHIPHYDVIYRNQEGIVKKADFTDRFAENGIRNPRLFTHPLGGKKLFGQLGHWWADLDQRRHGAKLPTSAAVTVKPHVPEPASVAGVGSDHIHSGPQHNYDGLPGLAHDPAKTSTDVYGSGDLTEQSARFEAVKEHWNQASERFHGASAHLIKVSKELHDASVQLSDAQGEAAHLQQAESHGATGVNVTESADRVAALQTRVDQLNEEQSKALADFHGAAQAYESANGEMIGEESKFGSVLTERVRHLSRTDAELIQRVDMAQERHDDALREMMEAQKKLTAIQSQLNAVPSAGDPASPHGSLIMGERTRLNGELAAAQEALAGAQRKYTSAQTTLERFYSDESLIRPESAQGQVATHAETTVAASGADSTQPDATGHMPGFRGKHEAMADQQQFQQTSESQPGATEQGPAATDQELQGMQHPNRPFMNGETGSETSTPVQTETTTTATANPEPGMGDMTTDSDKYQTLPETGQPQVTPASGSDATTEGVHITPTGPRPSVAAALGNPSNHFIGVPRPSAAEGMAAASHHHSAALNGPGHIGHPTQAEETPTALGGPAHLGKVRPHFPSSIDESGTQTQHSESPVSAEKPPVIVFDSRLNGIASIDGKPLGECTVQQLHHARSYIEELIQDRSETIARVTKDYKAEGHTDLWIRAQTSSFRNDIDRFKQQIEQIDILINRPGR